MLPGWLLIAAFLAFNSPIQGGGAASPQAAASTDVSVAGRVLDAVTGGPIAGATVRASVLLPSLPAGSSQPAPVELKTDGDGRFAFEHLVAGRLQLSASAAGYVSGVYTPTSPSNTPVLRPGARIVDATIRLAHSGSITGVVRDEHGTPLPQAAVRIFRRGILTTRRVWASTNRVVLADGSGVYRADDLAPGEYIVAVTVIATTIPTAVVNEVRRAAGDPAASPVIRSLLDSRGPIPMGNLVTSEGLTVRVSDGVHVLPAASSAADGIARAYRTTFHPSATSMNDAAVLNVKSGDAVAGVDIALATGAVRRVGGTLVKQDQPAAFVGLFLIADRWDERNEDYDAQVAVTATDASGAFTFLQVPDGDYTLKAVVVPAPPGRTNPIMPPAERLEAWASQPVHAAAADVSLSRVPLRSALTISGRAVFGGTGAMAPASQTPMTIWAAAVEGGMLAPPARVTLDAEGRFTLRGAMAGRYALYGGGGDGWQVESILAEGRNITDAPIVMVDHDVTDVTLLLTGRLTRVFGQVEDAAGAPAVNAHVVAFPADYQRWVANGQSIRTMRSTRSSATGTYGVSELPPGDYLIAAFPDGDTQGWPDRRVVESIAKVATRVTVAPGAPIPLTLTLSRITK